MNVWEHASLRGYAQALTPKEEILKVRAWPVAKIRDLAAGQLKLAKDAFAKAASVAWYAGLYIRWINDTRWGPYLKQIQDAEESFQAGENAQTDEEKRQHYLSAWTVSRLAVSQIAKEADFGETGFVYLAEDTGRAIASTATPFLSSAGDKADEILKVMKWGLGLGLALYILRELRR